MAKRKLFAIATIRRMRALEVYLNGEKLCVAGFADDVSLVAAVGFVNDLPCDLTVAGCIGSNRDFAKWVNRDLNIGDEVAVKIVEAEGADQPISVQKAKKQT